MVITFFLSNLNFRYERCRELGCDLLIALIRNKDRNNTQREANNEGEIKKENFVEEDPDDKDDQKDNLTWRQHSFDKY